MQVLHAPWWWRAARTALAAGAALLVVVVAEVGLMSEIGDATVAVLLTVLSSFGVTAYMTWRQTKWAREIAGSAGEHARPASVVAHKLRLTGALLLAVAVLSVFLQSAADTVSAENVCQRYAPYDPHFPGVFEGHAANHMCPVSPIQHTDDISWVQGADGNYGFWFPSVGGLLTMTSPMRAAWINYRQLLGDPVDTDRFDGCSRYINFARGYLLESPGQPVVVASGNHRPSLNTADCFVPDRPYLTSVVQDGDGDLQLDWKYPAADAYNVSYWVVGRPGIVSIEAARTHFVFDHPEPGVTYGFQIQACRKHLLGRSKCTTNSNAVAVHTRP
ncbi:hypothetical protein GCM10018954_028200 [Kutzneria kofuensis]